MGACFVYGIASNYGFQIRGLDQPKISPVSLVGGVRKTATYGIHYGFFKDHILPTPGWLDHVESHVHPQYGPGPAFCEQSCGPYLVVLEIYLRLQ